MDLDVLNPDHVANHAVLDADLGVGGRHLVVISGIALPAWRIDDDHVHREECRLRLRVPVGTMEQATVHTGLASISNDDTEYVFASDQSRLEVDEAGELVLVTHLAVMGEWSALNRFSYQIVLTSRVVVSEISGAITWPSLTRPPPAYLHRRGQARRFVRLARGLALAGGCDAASVHVVPRASPAVGSGHLAAT